MTTLPSITPPRGDRLDLLPPPGQVHRRLGDVLREAALLRRLLRLSTQAAAERARRDLAAAEEAKRLRLAAGTAQQDEANQVSAWRP